MLTRCLLLLALVTLAASGVTASSPEAPRRADFLDQVFAELDRNGDEQLSRAEFRSIFKALQRTAHPRPEGARSKAEFIEYASSRLGDEDPTMLKQFADAIDQNNDGWISVEEFDQRMQVLELLRDDGDSSDGPRNPRQSPPVRDLENKTADYEAYSRRALPRDSFAVFDSPKMTSAVDATIADEAPVIGVSIAGEAKAYPVSVMGKSELGNDVCGGVPIAVSW